MTKLTKIEIHNIGVEYAAMRLIENGISTCENEDDGIDLILDNGKTILVRAMSEENRLAVGVDNLNNLKSDYLIIVANLKFTTLRKIYILPIEIVKNISINKPRRSNDKDDFFINRAKYTLYHNNYNILKE